MGRWQNMTSQIGFGVWCGVVLWCGVVVWFGLVWSGVVLPPPSSFGWGLPSSFWWWCSPLSSIGVVCSLLHREKTYVLRPWKVARLTLQTRKLWLVGWSVSRPTVTLVTLACVSFHFPVLEYLTETAQKKKNVSKEIVQQLKQKKKNWTLKFALRPSNVSLVHLNSFVSTHWLDPNKQHVLQHVKGSVEQTPPPKRRERQKTPPNTRREGWEPPTFGLVLHFSSLLGVVLFSPPPPFGWRCFLALSFLCDDLIPSVASNIIRFSVAEGEAP